ncbi:MAG: hypothetical protein GY819_17530 [Planctomycetaceae bacterium]|nr:hypothetical protein [Planctomycetaceae bacterium]
MTTFLLDMSAIVVNHAPISLMKSISLLSVGGITGSGDLNFDFLIIFHHPLSREAPQAGR